MAGVYKANGPRCKSSDAAVSLMLSDLNISDALVTSIRETFGPASPINNSRMNEQTNPASVTRISRLCIPYRCICNDLRQKCGRLGGLNDGSCLYEDGKCRIMPCTDTDSVLQAIGVRTEQNETTDFGVHANISSPFTSVMIISRRNESPKFTEHIVDL